MENSRTKQASLQADYCGYFISSTAEQNESGARVPSVEVTLRGRPMTLSPECPDLAQPTGEDAVGKALAWARHRIDSRELPVSDNGNRLLSKKH
jgi:hypothetical protein